MRRFRLLSLTSGLILVVAAIGRPCLAQQYGPACPPASWAWRSVSVGERWHVDQVTLPSLPKDEPPLTKPDWPTSLARYWGCEETWPTAAAPSRSIWTELYSRQCDPAADPREAAFAARKAALVGGDASSERGWHANAESIQFTTTAIEGHVADVVRDYRHSVGVIEVLRLNADNQGRITCGRTFGRRPTVANSNWVGASTALERPYEYDYSHRHGHRYAGDCCHDEKYGDWPECTLATADGSSHSLSIAAEIVREDLVIHDSGADRLTLSVSSAEVREMLTCTSRFFRCLGEACRSLSHQLAEAADDIHCEQKAIAARCDKNGATIASGSQRSSTFSANYRGL
jgi:hypothetical protein